MKAKTPGPDSTKQDISNANAAFWNELCGSQLARSIGVTDNSPESLAKFDKWYLDFYPYLHDYLELPNLSGKKVLEIGLGYGTVAQLLAEAAGEYTGLDIAEGPVQMVNHRIKQKQIRGKAVCGSILNPPFTDNEFDYIFAIGSLHHTGDLEQAINNCHRLLKPQGKLVFMVYYAYSYRRLFSATKLTALYTMRELAGFRGVVGLAQSKHRSAYDANSAGDGAPHTDWISRKSLKYLCRQFSNFQARTENIEQEMIFRRTPRKDLLTTRWPRFFGLDLYAVAQK